MAILALPWLIVLVAFIWSLRPLGDPDVWWHLRTGEQILTSGWPTSDPWSFASTEDTPWVLHEWLVEVAFALGHRIAGYDAVIVIRALLFSGLIAVVVWQARRRSGPLVAAVVASVVTLGVLSSSAERPQLVSFLLLAWIGPLMLTRTLVGKPMPWWTLIIWPLWANSHGLWASALLLYAVLVTAFVLASGGGERRKALPMIGYGVLATALVALNPAGPRLLLAPLDVREYAQFVSEWDPPSLVALPGAALALLLAIITVSWARSKVRVDPVTIAYVAVAALMGVSYLRTVAIGCLLLAPLAAESLAQLLQGRLSLEQRARSVEPSRRTRWLGAGAMGAAALGAAAIVLPAVPALPENTPWGATRYLQGLDQGARVLNEYDLGGWVLWTVPNASPAIDGRTEIYSPDYVRTSMDAGNLRGDWQQYLDSLHVDAAWLRQDTPLVTGLEEIEGWQRVYEDDWSVILVPQHSR